MTAAAILSRLLAEDTATARARRLAAFEQAAGGRPLVLYGAGGHGRRVLATLRRRGIEPLCFADARPAAESIDDLPVLSLDDAAARHGTSAAFVVCVFNPAAPYRRVRDSLLEQGCETVLSWITLAWRFADDLLPTYAVDVPERVLEQRAAVSSAFDLLADEASREEYVAQVRWRLFGGDAELPASRPVDESYFSDDVVTLRADEVFADCGAFDGDTLQAFLARAGVHFSRYLALEPDPANLELLRSAVEQLPGPVAERVEILPFAASDAEGTARWSTGAGGAGIDAAGEIEVQTVPLDVLLDGRGPTYLKFDIEGAEPQALAGAAQLVTRDRPVLGICAYHAQEHLWTLPTQLDELSDGYRLSLRRYEADGFQVVLYGVPEERVLAAAP